MKFLNYIFLILLLASCTEELEKVNYVTNYKEGIELSKAQNKPVFLFFTGYGATNVREFDDFFASYPPIAQKLNKDFISIVLYVDDRKQIVQSDTLGFSTMNLPSNFWKSIDKYQLKTIGNLNSILQTSLYASKGNHQPLYTFRDLQGNDLIEPFGYLQRNKQAFLDKVKEASKAFQKNNTN